MPTGVRYPEAIDLAALERAHPARYAERTVINVDGNTAAAIPFLQWWRAPIVAGFPITPSTKWLEHIAAEVASGKFDKEIDHRKVRTKRVKLLEAEHAVADYMVGAAGSCRELIVGTATSSVGLDHMAETVRSLGASGLGNVVLVNVCRATANFPLCIEGDPSDHFAHRDSGFIQYMNRGKQQIYDSILQLPAVGMHPGVLTPTMPAFYGIKDSHRSAKLTVEPDAAVNAFLDDALAWGRHAESPAFADFVDSGCEVPQTPPGLLDGDTAMGSCVTSAYFQGFKVAQKRRLQHALTIIPEIGKRFARTFGRPGLQLFEEHGFEERPDAVLVAIGPDAGTALQLLPRWREQLRAKIGVLVLRLITPFPAQAIAAALRGVKAVGVVNQAFHHGRGHLTLDLESALHGDGQRTPVDAFFCGLGGAGVSAETWTEMARLTLATARSGAPSKQWHQLHEARELDEAAQEDAA